MAITTNLDVKKRGGRISFTIDEPKLAEQFFGFSKFEFGDDPHGPLMVVQVIPPDAEFATHYHDTDYCTLVLEGIAARRTHLVPGRALPGAGRPVRVRPEPQRSRRLPGRQLLCRSQ